MTQFVSKASGHSVEVDLDAVLDQVEAACPGEDPVPIARRRVLEQLDLDGLPPSDEDVMAIEQAVMAGLRKGRFPDSVTLESNLYARPPRRSPRKEATEPEEVEGFDLVVPLPNDDADSRFEALIGLDGHKRDMLAIARELRDPARLRRWAAKHHAGASVPILERLHRRVPLIVLAGDVGSGKTELAETFGSVLARDTGEEMQLLRLGLAARGTGMQGQATAKIQAAFATAKRRAQDTPVVLLLDEADAIAQSREEAQMHHEDRAGVNALIQAVDQVRELDGRLIVVMCTNRSSALDPALVRRAALVLRFDRPDRAARASILKGALGPLLEASIVEEVAGVTGVTDGRPSFAASDLVTRVVPQAIRRAASEDRPLTVDDLLDVVRTVEPTPPFRDE
ncbi:MAG: AAA family ATPase [Myxococcota bacterium]